MTSFQFLHIDTFGRFPKRGAARHATAVGVLNEGGRLATASGHLQAPRPPNILYGLAPADLVSPVQHLIQQAKDSRGRSLRSDAGVLAATVISYPIPRLAVKTEAGLMQYQQWRTATLHWLMQQFPTTLMSVVEHIDESQLHLHAFLVPPLKPDGQLCWAECHPGRAARQVAADRGLNKTAQNFAYQAAMKSWQDDFHSSVSARFGHDRTGPLRERRRREEHLKLAKLERQLAEAQATIASLEASMRAQAAAGILETPAHAEIPGQATAQALQPVDEPSPLSRNIGLEAGGTPNAISTDVTEGALEETDGEHCQSEEEETPDHDSFDQAGYDDDFEADPDPEPHFLHDEQVDPEAEQDHDEDWAQEPDDPMEWEDS